MSATPRLAACLEGVGISALEGKGSYTFNLPVQLAGSLHAGPLSVFLLRTAEPWDKRMGEQGKYLSVTTYLGTLGFNALSCCMRIGRHRTTVNTLP
jgi:hypothetical protein